MLWPGARTRGFTKQQPLSQPPWWHSCSPSGPFATARGEGWRIRNWARVGQGGVWAHKVYKRTVTFGLTSFVEDTRVILRHVPQP